MTLSFITHNPADLLPLDAVLDQELALINTERAKVGAPPLVRDARLDKAAQDYAIVLANGAPFSHTGPDGSSPFDRMKRAGFPTLGWSGENIARGYTDAATVMAAFMASPGHAANIRQVNFTVVGLGLASGTTGWNWVQDFGQLSTPPPPPPVGLSVTVAMNADNRTFTGTVSEALPAGSVVTVNVADKDGRIAGAQVTVGGITPPPPPGAPVITMFQPKHNPVGGWVILQGTGFDPQSTASFNGIIATEYQTRDVIGMQARIPASATTGPLFVRRGSDGATSAGVPFIVDSAAPTPGGPILTEIVPNHGAPGTLVSAKGQVLGDGTCFLIFTTADGKGARADVVSFNSGALACHVPAGATTGAAFVSRHSDNTHSAGLLFTVDGPGSGP